MNHNTVTPVRLEPAAPGLKSTALPDGIIVLVTKLPKHRENVPFFLLQHYQNHHERLSLLWLQIYQNTRRLCHCFGTQLYSYQNTRRWYHCFSNKVTKNIRKVYHCFSNKVTKKSGKCIIVLLTINVTKLHKDQKRVSLF